MLLITVWKIPTKNCNFSSTNIEFNGIVWIAFHENSFARKCKNFQERWLKTRKSEKIRKLWNISFISWHRVEETEKFFFDIDKKSNFSDLWNFCSNLEKENF